MGTTGAGRTRATAPDPLLRFRRQLLALNRHPTLRLGARLGLAMKGLVFVTVGAIAVGVLLGAGGRASQPGALAAIATTRIGVVLLWVATGSLWALGLWQLTEAIRVQRTSRFRRIVGRLVPLGKALGFVGTGFLALAFALGFQLGNRNGMARLTEVLLTTVTGQVVLFTLGAIVIAVGFAAVFRGVSRHFREEVDTRELRPGWRRTVDVLGVAGYVSKGIAYGVGGGLLIAALLTGHAQNAGLDGALKYLVSLPQGTLLLAVVALGLLGHGLYLGARSLLFSSGQRRIVVRGAGASGSPGDPPRLA